MLYASSIALSGLNAMSDAIDIVGNNLSNLNTTGYKDTVANFRDVMAQSGGSAENQIGLGTASPLNSRVFSQGTISSTQGQFDAALNGNGFFVVKDSTGANLFTRDGSFQQDANGYLVTSTGEYVQGWSTDSGALSTNGPIGNIQVPVGQSLPPQATSTLSLSGNLNGSAISGSSAATMAYTMQTVDSLGNYVPVTFTFTKDPTTSGQWDYSVSSPNLTVSINDPNAITTTSNGVPTTTYPIQFDANGNMTMPKVTDAPISVTLKGTGANGALADGAQPIDFNWSLYKSDGTPTFTQYSESSAISGNSQNGRQAAQLLSVSLANGGQIVANYSNGAPQQVVGQLAVAGIRNPESLVDVGNNNFTMAADTAPPAIGTGGSGGRGTIQGSALEASTVDVASEFSKLLVYQRSYQANSRVVTVADQLSQDALNLIHQ